jgi:hypothetical protein
MRGLEHHAKCLAAAKIETDLSIGDLHPHSMAPTEWPGDLMTGSSLEGASTEEEFRTSYHLSLLRGQLPIGLDTAEKLKTGFVASLLYGLDNFPVYAPGWISRRLRAGRARPTLKPVSARCKPLDVRVKLLSRTPR